MSPGDTRMHALLVDPLFPGDPTLSPSLLVSTEPLSSCPISTFHDSIPPTVAWYTMPVCYMKGKQSNETPLSQCPEKVVVSKLCDSRSPFLLSLLPAAGSFDVWVFCAQNRSWEEILLRGGGDGEAAPCSLWFSSGLYLFLSTRITR